MGEETGKGPDPAQGCIFQASQRQGHDPSQPERLRSLRKSISKPLGVGKRGSISIPACIPHSSKAAPQRPAPCIPRLHIPKSQTGLETWQAEVRHCQAVYGDRSCRELVCNDAWSEWWG